MNNLFKTNIIRHLIIIVCASLILSACNSSKLIQEDEKKCPYLEGKDD